MDDTMKQDYIEKLTDNLPMLRAKLKLTQKELASIIGVSAFTVLAIEKRQRKMTWSTFLSLILIFIGNPETRQVLAALDIYNDDLISFIEGRKTI